MPLRIVHVRCWFSGKGCNFKKHLQLTNGFSFSLHTLKKVKLKIVFFLVSRSVLDAALPPFQKA